VICPARIPITVRADILILPPLTLPPPKKDRPKSSASEALIGAVSGLGSWLTRARRNLKPNRVFCMGEDVCLGFFNGQLMVAMRKSAPSARGQKLAGTIAVVAGATRGAGRALAEASAKVYGTGRSLRGNPSTYNRPETIEETAEMISAAGGSAVALRVDHTVEAEVEALFQRVDRDCGRLDLRVNSIAGENPLMAQWCSFWKTDLKNAEAALRQSLLSHIITAKHAAPYLIRNRRGLIVEVTENDVLSAGGNPVTQTVKLALKGLALNMAAELRPHGVAAVAITLGFLPACRTRYELSKPLG
jgi:NAD(P)-dependent dehydrogenase (short-subunit alcohol dehydrogenase family)